MDTKLNLDLLQTLMAVAETGELKKAARKVFRSHSAVSMQIRRLETLTGARLIERHSRGVRLTGKGHTLLAYASRLLEINTAALAALRDDNLTGGMRFGIPTDYARTFITRLLPLLKIHLPDMDTTIVCDRSRRLRKQIGTGALDVALVAGESDIEDERIIWNERLVWCGAPDFSFPENRKLPVAVFNDDCMVRDVARRDLKQAGIAYRTVFTSPILDNVADAVYNGLAVSLLPESMAPSSKTRPVPGEIVTCSTVMRMNLIRSAAVETPVFDTVARYTQQAFTQPVRSSQAVA